MNEELLDMKAAQDHFAEKMDGHRPTVKRIHAWIADGRGGIKLRAVSINRRGDKRFKREWLDDFHRTVGLVALKGRPRNTDGVTANTRRKLMPTIQLVKTAARCRNEDEQARLDAWLHQFELHNGRKFDPAIDDPKEDAA